MKHAPYTERYNTLMDNSIKIGFLKDFKGEDSLLISVNINGLLKIEELFQSLSLNSSIISFKNIDTYNPQNLDLTLQISNSNIGLIKTGKKLNWILTIKQWGSIREKATSLIKNSTSGHHYLDSENPKNKDIQVILSLNEYGQDFWKNVL